MEKFLFLSKFLQSPKTVGSITPSSRFLARAMVNPIDWPATESIAELGAGTGIFTRYLHELKHPGCKVMVFERDDNMRNRLESLYPDLYYHDNAVEIYSAMKKHHINQFDYVISGLPFMNFSQELRDAIMEGVEKSLKPGGMFIAFQYSLQMKKQLEQRFNRLDINFVPINIPPAFVYCCQKA
ncbi:class I SAM-dependent methyltransferase [Aneurinibacillus terranovensis]|uniref:class I SAM-dependent methyltransferase n=1 Tax=Aneurinibacillus terranovensis TaxID=278991 RepID=UPI00041F0B67|nr:methyltransferase domain-containing protein [Aneurinibacillus terranovensis]